MLAGLVKEKPGEEGEDPRKVPSEGLAEGVEDDLLESASPMEA